jgi:hypothetical protein
VTVRLVDGVTIVLEGQCEIDDADPLLRHLLAAPHATVDWRLCQGAHTAIIQILLASKAVVHGLPDSIFLQRNVAPLVKKAQD